MNLLAIDSSSSILSVAACRADETHYAKTDACTKHSELVMDMIDSQTKKASLKPNDLDGVLCMGGPGSFTGLRIGFSIAKGLALSLSIPFAPVPTLDCMAFPCRERALVLAAIEARKNTFFYAFYHEGERLKPESLQDEDARAEQIALEIQRYKEKITLTGTGAASLYGLLLREAKQNIEPDLETRGYARELITVAKMSKIFENDNTAFLYSGPEYIRKTDAELNLSARL
jgi:tRNA threonylcarbamoyladenosine biosynthesis protein TsaB